MRTINMLKYHWLGAYATRLHTQLGYYSVYKFVQRNGVIHRLRANIGCAFVFERIHSEQIANRLLAMVTIHNGTHNVVKRLVQQVLAISIGRHRRIWIDTQLKGIQLN